MHGGTALLSANSDRHNRTSKAGTHIDPAAHERVHTCTHGFGNTAYESNHATQYPVEVKVYGALE